MNMGIEPFLVATSVHLICAQRLVRRSCPTARMVEVPVQALIEEGYSPEEAEDRKNSERQGWRSLQQQRLQRPNRFVRGDGSRRRN